VEIYNVNLVKIALLVLVIVAIAQQFVEIYSVNLEKIVPLVLAIADHVLFLTPIVVTDTAIQVVGKTVYPVQMIVEHVLTFPHAVMARVI
jgi:hypothetical protein